MLTIASMIVFKMLNWYSIVARNPLKDAPENRPTKTRNRTQILSDDLTMPRLADDRSYSSLLDGAYGLAGEDSGRMAAQHVLGELHLVQGLVNNLSNKLKSCGPKDANEMFDGADTGAKADLTFAISSSTLESIEPELKSRTRSLASNIIEMLQQE